MYEWNEFSQIVKSKVGYFNSIYVVIGFYASGEIYLCTSLPMKKVGYVDFACEGKGAGGWFGWI